MMSLSHCFIFLLFYILLNIAQGAIHGNLTVTPATVKANGQYYFIIDTTTIIPAGGYFTITFPSQVTLSATATCTYQFGFTGTPTCSVITGNILKVSGAFPNAYGMQLKINTAQNPGSAQLVQNFIFKFYNSANTLLDSSSATAFSFQYVTDILLSASLAPISDYVVGDTAEWLLSVTPKNPIPIGGIVKLYMPKWNTASLFAISAQSLLASGVNTCTVVSGLSATSITCSFYIDPIPANQDVLTIYSAFTTQQNSGITFQIKIADVHNPPTTRPYTNFDVYTFDSAPYGIDSTTGITVTMTTPATLPASQARVTVTLPTTVDALTLYQFQIFVNNPIPMGGQIRIRIPTTIGVTALTQVIADQRINAAVTVAPVSPTNQYYVQLSGGYPTVSDSVPPLGLVAFKLKYLQNPSTATTTTSFQIETYDSTYIIEQITTGLTIKATNGAITMLSLTYSDQRVLEYDAISFKFKLKSALQPGSTIEVVFPPEFTCQTVTSTSCTLLGVSGLSASATCSITANKLVITAPFGATTSTGGETIAFTVGNNYIQNPTSTRPTATGITVKSVSQLGNPIDKYTGSTFTATVNSFSAISIAPANLITGAYPTTYIFTLQTPHSVEKNAVILIKLPNQDQDLYIQDTNIAESSCTAIQTLSAITCSSQDFQVIVNKGFSTAVCSCTTAIKFSIPGFINPRSTTPSSTFQLYINTYDGYFIYQKLTSLTVTMTTANILTTVNLTQSNGQNGAIDNYLFTIKNHNIKMDGDILYINAPTNEVSFTSSTVCAARTGVRGFTYCTMVSATQMKVSLLFNSRILIGQRAINKGFNVLLMNVQNPPSFKPSQPFTFSTYTSNGYKISSIPSGPTVKNTKPGNMTMVLIKPDAYADGKWTNLTFTIIPSNYLQYMSLQIKVASDVPLVQAYTTNCVALSSYSVSSTIFCDYFSNTNTIKITNAFSKLSRTQYQASSPNLQQLQFSVGQFINPTGKNQSFNFTLTTYDQSGYLIDIMNASILYMCSPTCLTCDRSDYTKCTSCNKTSIFPYLYSGMCVNSCPPGTVLNNWNCIVCQSTCANCSLSSDECMVCKDGYYKYNGECTKYCPDGYQQIDGQCKFEIIVVQTDQKNDNTTDFIQYFQIKEGNQCFMFPFSIAAIIISLATLLVIIIQKIIFSRRQTVNQSAKSQNKKQKNKKITDFPTQTGNLNSIRYIEPCITLISFVELVGWVFYLICMLHISDMLSLYIISGAIGLNLIFNFVMICTIFRSKEKKDEHMKQFSESLERTHLCIKYYTLIFSHRGFYMIYFKYLNGQQKLPKNTFQRCFDYSYIDSNCSKIFFLMSILLIDGAVIVACILNYLHTDQSQQVFCLDIDLIALSGYQSLLILITLITCTCQLISRIKFNTIKPKKNEKSDPSSPNKKNGPSGGSRASQNSSSNKYMKSVNMDSEEEGDDPNKSHRSSQGAARKSSRLQITDNSSVHNTSNQILLSKNNKEVIKREEALKSIIKNVRKKGVITIDGLEDFEQEFIDNEKQSHLRNIHELDEVSERRIINRRIVDDFTNEDVETLGGELNTIHNKRKINNRHINIINYEEEDSDNERPKRDAQRGQGQRVNQTISHGKSSKSVHNTNQQKYNKLDDSTLLIEDNVTIHTINHRRRNRKDDLGEDDEEEIERNRDSLRIINTEKSQDSLQIFRPDNINHQEVKNKTQRIVRNIKEVNDTEEHYNSFQQLPRRQLESVREPEQNNIQQLQKEKPIYDQMIYQISENLSEKMGIENNNPAFDRASYEKELSQLEEQILEQNDPCYSQIQQSLPTQYQEQVNIEPNQPHFSEIQKSLPTQHDEMIVESKSNNAVFENNVNQTFYAGKSENEVYFNKSGAVYEELKHQFSMNAPTEEFLYKTNAAYGMDERMQEEEFMNKTQSMKIDQNDPMHKTGFSNKPSEIGRQEQYNKTGPIEAQIKEIMYKTGSMNTENATNNDKESLTKTIGKSETPHQNRNVKQYLSSKEEQIQNRDPAVFSQINRSLPTQYLEQESQSKTISDIPNQELQPQVQQKQEQFITEEEEEELKDQVNQDDIKPQRNVIFSDKSESSVEEMMEDTPSNYNIPNGRLEEDSKGLRSILYKSLAKKYLYHQMLGQSGLIDGKEDEEAQKINNKSQERKSFDNSNNLAVQRSLSQLSNKKFDNEKEMVFVKNLVQQQQEEQIKQKIEQMKGQVNNQNPGTTNGGALTARKSSIGEAQPKMLEENHVNLHRRYKTPMRNN